MKLTKNLASCIFILALTTLNSCKKDNYIVSLAPPTPAAATINFHIKDSSMINWGEPVILSRIVSTSSYTYYNSRENIYLRTGIDTTFIYSVSGNTNNTFTVGGASFDGIPIYKEEKFIVAGSNIKWEITY